LIKTGMSELLELYLSINTSVWFMPGQHQTCILVFVEIILYFCM